VTLHPPTLVYDEHENAQGRTTREQQFADEQRAYEAAQEQAERQHQEAQRKAEAAAEAAEAVEGEIEAQETINRAGVSAVQKLLLSQGAEATATTLEAKTALDEAMADDGAGVEDLFVAWSMYRRASAIQVGLVGRGRYWLAMMGGVRNAQMATDALESIPFTQILDQALTIRNADDAQHAASLTGEVSRKAMDEARRKLQS
jgi:hypothetical protein